MGVKALVEIDMEWARKSLAIAGFIPNCKSGSDDEIKDLLFKAIGCYGVKDANTKFAEYEDIAQEAISSVYSKPKIGHWITLKDEWGDINEAVCSCCDVNGNHKWHYCPNCGARMVEPQTESEK